MVWQTPPNSVGTNLGSIVEAPTDPNDPNGPKTLGFDPNANAPTDSHGHILADNGVVNVTNGSSVKTNILLQYQVTDSSGTSWTYQQQGCVDSGNSTFLVIDPGVAATIPTAVSVEIYAWPKGSQQPTTTIASPSVVCPRMALEEVTSVEIWDDSGQPRACVAVAIAGVQQNDGTTTYSLALANETTQCVDIWLNGKETAATTVDPSDNTSVDMADAGNAQWIIGFTNGDDPSIVVRRPPIQTPES